MTLQENHDLLLDEVRILRDRLAAAERQLVDHSFQLADQHAQLLEVRKLKDQLAVAERRVVKTEDALAHTALRRDVYGDMLKEHDEAIDELRRVQARILEWMKDRSES